LDRSSEEDLQSYIQIEDSHKKVIKGVLIDIIGYNYKNE
jgi:ubiquitin